MVCCTSRRRASSWLCITTSLSTIATTRLSGCTSACATAPRNSAPNSSGRMQSESFVFTFTITLNAFVEESLDLITHYTAQTLEYDLQEDAAIRFVVKRGIQADFVVVDPVTVDQAQFPAAAVVLEAGEGLQGTVAAVVILPAGNHAPLRHDRPDDREIVLTDLVVVLDVVGRTFGAVVAVAYYPVTTGLVVAHGVIAVAIPGVNDLVRIVFGLVMEHRATRAGAVSIRVPVEVRAQAPVAVEAIHILQRIRRLRGLRVRAGTVVDAGHLNLAVFEVEGLADAEALALEAVVFDPAIGYAQRQLVLVADTVLAGEAVLAEQRGIVESAFAGVEHRDIGLVFLGNIEVEQARFQGLAVVLAEPLGVAVEVQAAVQAEHADATALAALVALFGQQAVLALAVQTQVVVGVQVLDLGRKETPAPVQRQADSGFNMYTLAIGAGQTTQTVVVPAEFISAGIAIFIGEKAAAKVAIKAHIFCAVRKVQPRRLEGQLAVQGQLRQAVVRRDVGNIGQFVGVGVEARRVAVATIGQGAALVDIAGGANAEVGIQILEVIRIADVGVVDFGQQARVQAGLVLPAVHPALVFVLGLQLAIVVAVVEVGRAELAFAALGQVTELTFHKQTAVGHISRVERGIVIRCQVEVVRGLQAQAIVAGAAEARRQEAGLAAIVDREIDIGGVEHRNVLHPQGHVGRGAETGSRVQGDVVALQVPGVAARFAAGVGAVFQADNGAFFALGVERAAASMALVQHILGVLDLGFAVVQLQLGAIADHQHALVAQAHVTDQLAAVFRLMQVGFVGFDLHAGLA